MKIKIEPGVKIFVKEKETGEVTEIPDKKTLAIQSNF